jgi:clan AA aspartic protease (TIGR02281 family)
MPIIYYGFLEWAVDMLLAGVATCALMTCGAGKEAQKPAQPSHSSSEPRPPIARPTPGGQRIAINGDADFQCYVDFIANGETFSGASSGLIDTGANDVAFGKNMAARLGFDLANLPMDETYGSANGTGHQSTVTLRELKLGGVVVAKNISASILNANMSHPLLGASLLKSLHLTYSAGNCELYLPGNGTVATKRGRMAMKY